ncbi:DUF397 domain-containing protein [Streptomyces ossamyceticus]|uniref:DUF397 domain-containing protein n=1 Tax=Streptomyces ossamyceticus TaxID=249581 RepID=UPI003EBA680B
MENFISQTPLWQKSTFSGGAEGNACLELAATPHAYASASPTPPPPTSAPPPLPSPASSSTSRPAAEGNPR